MDPPFYKQKVGLFFSQHNCGSNLIYIQYKVVFYKAYNFIIYNIDMGNCASTEQTVQPKFYIMQEPPKRQFMFQFAHEGQNCSSSNIYMKEEIAPGQLPPEIDNFSMMMLNNILTQFVEIDVDQKQAILKNIEKLDFGSMQYLGCIKISNKQTCVSILDKNQVDFMVASNFNKGRTLAVAHQSIFKDYLVKDKNWIIFLRNVILWLTKNKKSSKQKPIKILITASTYDPKIIKELARSSVFIELNCGQKISNINLQNYDCIFMYELANKYFGNDQCNKVVEYVRNGGGLLISLRGWLYKSYGEGKNLKNWKIESCYNKILTPMGLFFSEEFTTVEAFNMKPKQVIQLSEPQLKPYTKQLNPSFNQSFDQKQLGEPNQLKNILLEGVGDCNFGDACFSSFDYPYKSFVSIMKQGEKDFCVAGNYGKGKIFLFGHGLIYSLSDIKKGKLKRLIQNILKWMVGSEPQVYAGLLYEKGGWNNFGWNNLDKSVISQVIENPDEFLNYDVICGAYYSHYPAFLNQNAINKLNQYVKDGGNLFFATHGWVWQNYGEGKDNKALVYEKNYASYVLLKSFDLTLNRDWFYPTKPYKVSVNKSGEKDMQILNFLTIQLLAVLKDQRVTAFSTSQPQLNKYQSKIQATQGRQFSSICSLQLYHEIVDAFIQSRFNVEKNYDKLSFKDAFICRVFNLMNALSYACPAHVCRALPPSLNGYPGSSNKRLKQKTVEVYKNRNKIIFSGLFLNAGEVVRVTHNHSAVETRDVLLKLNFNLDLTNNDNGKLKRFTHITRTFKIKPKQFLIASPHGGILYFEIGTKYDTTIPLNFTFEGAYQIPYWNQNIHSYADFQKIKKIDASMFIIQTKRMNLIGPTSGIFGQLNINIQRLCKYWNTVVGIYKDYRGIEQYPFHKDAICNDVNLALGYMHSGNPIMTHDDITFQMIGIGEKLYTNACWGFYHELGHNHQDYKWTVSETVQVTCNIYSLYLINRMHGTTIAQNMWVQRKLQDTVKKYFQKPSRSMKDYGQDPFLALVLYAVIMEEFGYEVFGKVHKAYNSITLPDKSYETMFDTLVQQVSLATNQNFWYYFKNWGMPVTNKSLNKLSAFKKYQCKKFPFITNQ